MSYPECSMVLGPHWGTGGQAEPGISEDAQGITISKASHWHQSCVPPRAILMYINVYSECSCKDGQAESGISKGAQGITVSKASHWYQSCVPPRTILMSI